MKLNKLTPNFAVHTIKETIDFYQSVLGFSLVMAVPETQDSIEHSISLDKAYVYALVSRDNVEIMLQSIDSFKKDIRFAQELPVSACVSFYMEVDRLNELYNSIKDRVDEITEIKTTWYGMKEFYLKDINGYILGFAEKSG